MLMELTRQAGNEPPLVGLMRVYKDFFPDIILGDVTSGRASVFIVGSSVKLSDRLLMRLSIQIPSGGKGLGKSR
jgi:hypothetical protein